MDINTIVGIAGGVSAALPIIIPIGRFLYALLAQKYLPGNVRAAIDQTVSTVVHGVEQGMQEASGPDKKAAAVNAVNEILAHEHIKAPASLVNFAIEEAVLLMNSASSDQSTGAPVSMGFTTSDHEAIQPGA